MRNMDHALRFLYAVEKKNKIYFTEHNLKIAECVVLSVIGDAVGVSITNTSLPQSIKDDIGAMFWI